VNEYEALVKERETLKTVLVQNKHIRHKSSCKAAEKRLNTIRGRLSELAKAHKPLQ
jgi:hypothetical protein